MTQSEERTNQALIAEQREANAHMVQATLQAQDLTEIAELAREQAEASMEALKESENRYRTLFDLAPAAVSSCDATGLLQSFNRIAAKIWGQDPLLLSQNHLFSGAWKLFRADGTFVPPDRSPMAEVSRGEVTELRDTEMIIERPDGSRLTVVMNVRAIQNLAGKITGAIDCTYDITARKMAEQELESAIAVREQVLAIVSHDLRNPLSAIIMSSDALLRAHAHDSQEGRTKKVQIIERAAQRMSRLVNDLADFATVRSGILYIKRETHDPVALLREAATSFDAIATNAGINLVSEIVDFPSPIECDRDRIMQVFSNLIGNAVKVTARGGSVKLRAKDRGTDLLFSVSDTGPGIANNDLARIFLRYWRGENPQYKGTGLGLTIAKGIVTAHGGEIWVESTVGVGATFFFTIPRGQRQPDTIAAPKHLAPLAITVMVVDDEADIRDMMVELLEVEGFNVIAAVNGEDALVRLKSIAHLPHLILLDLMMPVMDGWTFVAERDKVAALRDIPLVVISGSHDVQAIAASLHASACIRKPVDRSSLIAMVHGLCDRKGALGEAKRSSDH